MKGIPDLETFAEPCFYAFRLPGSDKVEFGCAPSVVSGFATGFVIAPFQGRALTIPSHPESQTEEIPPIESAQYPYTSTTRDAHEARISKAVAKLKHTGGKVVLSRTLVIELPRNLNEVFTTLCRSYPDAFVFCYRTPQTGTWIGASPELLLRREATKLSTMALAGTRKVGTEGDWDAKNKEEQQIVTDYIANTLRGRGLIPEISPTGTRLAGPVEHLCTSISARICGDFDMEALLADLSPTPALGGYPKSDALRIINEIEDFPRGCYGGFIGPVGSDCKASLFVNLRSMLIRRDSAVLFIGGGITPKSIPDEEWRETELKAATLTQILRN